MKALKAIALTLFLMLSIFTGTQAAQAAQPHEDEAGFDCLTMGNLLCGATDTQAQDAWAMWDAQAIATTLPITTHTVEYVGYGVSYPTFENFPTDLGYTFYTITDGTTFHTFKVIEGTWEDAQRNMQALGWLTALPATAPLAQATIPTTQAQAPVSAPVAAQATTQAPAAAVQAEPFATVDSILAGATSFENMIANCETELANSRDISQCINTAISAYGEFEPIPGVSMPTDYVKAPHKAPNYGMDLDEYLTANYDRECINRVSRADGTHGEPDYEMCRLPQNY